ncbi:hypothetical protein DEO23_14705 [Brachybacterium endophyticum]|uniref:Uncharacterized protein n=1 Tax=Brachybacterium endophyticum TaxID=2182385 RepID=A0A2U2RHI2_9MICO|nr:hypothetical protein [Brachybacterium endophyticum]PWH05310.1 hypothetical protein DEO23_14705 [Brachybacterium endophyticum]
MFYRFRRTTLTAAVLALVGMGLAVPAANAAETEPDETAASSSLVQGPLINGPLVDVDGLLETLQLGQFQQ